VAADTATALSTERASAAARTLALFTGTAGVVLIGVFVLSITPRNSVEPLATSSTPSTDRVPAAQTVTPVAVSRPAAWAPGPQPLATLVGTAGLAVVTSRALGRMSTGFPAAQSGPSSITVRLDDGRAARASVIDPGDGRGLAVVAIDGPIAIDGMPVAQEQPGAQEPVTVMADEPIVVVYEDVVDVEVADGTAVVNRAGELIGLCSEDVAQRFIPIDELLVDATTPPD
jgi:S1-C subfamily serine protease